jgi:ABC-type Fe3+ transport system permease subunit
MDVRRPPAKQRPWKAYAIALFGIYLAGFSAYNLYQWYSAGQLYMHKFSEPHWSSLAREPVNFSFVAAVYVFALILFGGVPLASLFNRFRRGYKSLRRRK